MPPWRRLTADRQALLARAHLRCGHTYAQLAAGFGIGLATVYRYIAEAVEILAALAPTLQQALTVAANKAFVILDGTLLHIDRIAADRPYYSGKHKRHGMNVQVIADAFGRLVWVSPALPGAAHDIKAHVPTASSKPSPKPASGRGQTRDIREFGPGALPRALENIPSREAGGELLPRQNPSRQRAGQRHPEELAAPAQAPLQHRPYHRHRQGGAGLAPRHGSLRSLRPEAGQGQRRHQRQQGSPLTVADVRVTYDQTVDAAYIYLTEPQARVKSARTYPCDPMDVDGMINLDFDEQGRLIGIEVLAASSKLPEYLLQSAERLDTDGA